jgi:Fe-S oxidoreductase
VETLHPAVIRYLGIPGFAFGWLLLIVGVGLFAYIIWRRLQIILKGQKDPRFSDWGRRIWDVVVYGLIQKKQPRYFWAGLLHLMIFWGFVVLGLRSLDLVTQGLGLPLLRPLMESPFGRFFYLPLKDLFELIVLVACIWAILRRAIVKPKRYEGSHQFEAYLVLGLIGFLMLTDMFYEGSLQLLNQPNILWLPASQLASGILGSASPGFLKGLYPLSYWLHLLTFFFFLNFLPLGKHFHIITALPNVFFRKLRKGATKPARWGVSDITELEKLGAGQIEDFTWKHLLDLFSCTECGRCSDMCPANTVGRPLSPKMISIKLRDQAYKQYPLLSQKKTDSKQEEPPEIIGDLIQPDEVWSCTTCGACEEECPVMIEYIDKMIDMRRHMIETGQAPKTFNQVLTYFEKTGNPFGKPAAKRADWTKELPEVPVKVLKEGDSMDVLFFVDSYGSYDPRIQAIAGAIAKGFNRAKIDFGILGPAEWDSGHQVRRLGEEGLFQVLVEQNMVGLESVQFKRIVTTDPHAFNTLKKDYPKPFEVQHYAQFFLDLVRQGVLKLQNKVSAEDCYTYHDPCYLGRHNGIYQEPRALLRAIPGLQMVEMERARDRSFCCGGGDVILWHEIEQEEIRMAEKRIQMAREAGANVIVTACPFCLIHFEDAIKTAGLESQMRVIDLMELLVTAL